MITAGRLRNLTLISSDGGTRNVLFIPPKAYVRMEAEEVVRVYVRCEEVQEVRGNFTNSVGIL
jgi:hypothetical protein